MMSRLSICIVQLRNTLVLIIYLKYSKNKLVTVEEEDIPYASAVINSKNAQVNNSILV